MKKLIISLSFIILAALLVTSNVFADLPGSSWWSSLYVQNVGSNGGSMSMEAFDSTTTYGSDLFSFDYGQALAYDPGISADYGAGGAFIDFSSPLPSGFEGSVVISSSVPSAAVSQIANYRNGSVGVSGGTAAGRYQGISSADASTTLMMPKVKHNYVNHTTTFYVQAAGADTDVTYTFKMNDGGVYTDIISIQANRMFVLDPAVAGVPSTGCGYDSSVSPCYGSLLLESTMPIAATIVEHPHVGSPAGFATSTRMQSIEDQDTTLYHPAVKNNYWGQMDASAAVMNVGDAPAYVQITLKVTNVDRDSTANIGDIYTDYMILQSNESQVFDRFSDNFGGMPSGTYASAVIESLDTTEYDPQPLVTSTNDRKASDVPGGYGINLYAGYPDKIDATVLAGPTILEFVGYLTGAVTIQNVGDGTPTIVNYEFYEYGTDNVYKFSSTDTIVYGQAINTWGISRETDESMWTIIDGFSSFSELAGKQFSIIVTADQPIIGLVAEMTPDLNRDMCNYEMIPFDPDE